MQLLLYFIGYYFTIHLPKYCILILFSALFMTKIGERITSLRKKKGWSQTDLSKAIGASREAIGKYERNEAVPSVEVAKKIADELEVFLDYLVDDKAVMAFDKKTVKRLMDIDQLPDEDKNHIFYMIDNLIKAAKLKAI